MTRIVQSDAEMTQPQAELIERIRTLLSGQRSSREIAMFGGRSFMVNDKMVASARHGGDLLVRVAVSRDNELVQAAGATRAEMGAGRSMGSGWISVAAESIGTDERLSFWLDLALEHNRTTRP